MRVEALVGPIPRTDDIECSEKVGEDGEDAVDEASLSFELFDGLTALPSRTRLRSRYLRTRSLDCEETYMVRTSIKR